MRKIVPAFKKAVFGELSGNYGHNVIVRNYCRCSRLMPINASIQHGWYGHGIGEFKDRKERHLKELPLMLVWSNRIAEEWRMNSNIPVVVIGAPFVHYRKMNSIIVDSNAAGTVVFPQHSTPSSVEIHNVNEYCQELLQLEDEYKPITICLHFRDVDQYKARFEKYGFKVVTAGNSRQPKARFAENFYNILSAHKFASSNSIGSFAFYAVEMGIPFFLLGPISTKISRVDGEKINYFVGEHEKFNATVRELFSKKSSYITEEQRQFVLNEVGSFDAVRSEDLKRILEYNFWSELPRYPGRLLKLIISALFYLGRALKKPVKNSKYWLKK